jgi:hypothetical protein
MVKADGRALRYCLMEQYGVRKCAVENYNSELPDKEPDGSMKTICVGGVDSIDQRSRFASEGRLTIKALL